MDRINIWLKKKEMLWLVTAAILLVICVSAFKYRSGEINYYNSDATWHTLLTIEAYNETPISEHLFLPIVTLGSQSDKYITWGATIPDEKGNYYYTSFSSAGYFFPWLFMKILRLSVSEQSLYIFNSFLFAISAALWTWLIYILYENSKDVAAISIIGMLTYIFSPELLHGMGIVYWHQSVMQVTLLIQIIAYYQMKKTDRTGMYIVFYVMTLINPYIEWTGYVSNIGFALVELITNWKMNKKKGFGKACIIGSLTVISFGLFVVHYLLRVDAQTFFMTVKYRFFDRSIADESTLTDVFGGYFKSFLYLWILFLLLVIWNFLQNKKIELNHGMLMFVMAFPVLENVIMKEHAISYTYDRMKFIFFFSFLICELSYHLLSGAGEQIRTLVGILSITIGVCGLNLKSYISDESYIWEIDYRNDNQVLADYINEHYADSLISTSSYGVRGYINLLFRRGVFEGINADTLREIVKSQGKQYAVVIDFEDGANLYNENWNLCRISGISVYDVLSKEKYYVDMESVQGNKTMDGGYQLVDLTDINWTNGYSNTDKILLFYRDDDLLIDLLSHENIVSGNEIYHIENVDFDEVWIRVLVDRDAEGCMYPSRIWVE